MNKVKELISEIFWTEYYEAQTDRTFEYKFYHYVDDYFITGLIILNIIVISVESFEDIYHNYYIYFKIFDTFSIIIFTIEYILRIWSSYNIFDKNISAFRNRMKYILSPIGIIDLMAILPYYIPFIISVDLRFLRILRLMRLIRVFKLVHYSKSLQMLINVIKLRKQELFVTIFISTIMLLLTASIMYHLEHDIQPDKFPNIFSSLWWAVATLTTIGYGDVYPLTGWGQVLAALTALLGIGLVAIPTGIISSGFIEEIQKKNNSDKDKNKTIICPHCGGKIDL